MRTSEKVRGPKRTADQSSAQGFLYSWMQDGCVFTHALSSRASRPGVCQNSEVSGGEREFKNSNIIKANGNKKKVEHEGREYLLFLLPRSLPPSLLSLSLSFPIASWHVKKKKKKKTDRRSSKVCRASRRGSRRCLLFLSWGTRFLLSDSAGFFVLGSLVVFRFVDGSNVPEQKISRRGEAPPGRWRGDLRFRSQAGLCWPWRFVISSGCKILGVASLGFFASYGQGIRVNLGFRDHFFRKKKFFILDISWNFLYRFFLKKIQKRNWKALNLRTCYCVVLLEISVICLKSLTILS